MDYQRQKDIFDPSRHSETISVIGCGSVGSFTALSLAKMGCNVTELYDSDLIETHNLPNQFYKLDQLNVKKNVALQSLLSSFCGITPRLHEKIDGVEYLYSDIVVSCVDSMSARKIIWNNVKAQKKVKFYIDSRMGGKIFSLFCVDMKDNNSINHYESTLVDDSQTAELRCTERTIIYNVLGLASMICNNVSNYLNKEQVKKEIHFDYSNESIVVF